MILIRRTLSTIFKTLTQDYQSIYIRLLGVGYLQLGLIHTIGSLISAAISYPFGRIIDQKNSKNLLIVAMVLNALVPLIFFIANDWLLIPIAIIISSISVFCLTGVETIIVANAVKLEDRAKSFSILAAFTNIPRLIIPLLAGLFLTSMGGITVFNLKIFWFVQFLGLVLITFLVSRGLTETPSYERRKQPFWAEFKEILNSGIGLKRWLLIDTLSTFSYSVFIRYTWIYGVEEQGITPLVMGMMMTVYAVVGVLSSIPLGMLADKIGRVRVVVLLRPFAHVGMLLFLFTNDPRLFILGWAMRGTFQANIGILNAYRNELVPPSFRGRWMGVRELFRAVSRIPAPLIGGYLYSHVSPQAPFILRIICDLFIRVPLLLTMPTTISPSSGLKKNSEMLII